MYTTEIQFVNDSHALRKLKTETMDNNPLTPSLESSTMNLEKDLEEATVESLESFVITEEEPISESKDVETDPETIAKAHDVMTQSKYAQVY